MNSEENLEYTDFPEPLELKTEARRYIRAFTSAVQPVIVDINDGDEHILWACSLLLIPPPPPGVKHWVKSMPMSLAEIATLEWIKMVQDLASHMEALPTGFCVTEQQMASLLAKLERATGHPSCSTCRYPRRRCLCASGGSTLTPHKNWSSGTSSGNAYNQEYPLPTRGTMTVSVSQSRAPALTVAAPPQGVVSPVRRQPAMGVQSLTQHPPLGGSVNYASASLSRPTIRQPGPRSSQPPPLEPPAMETLTDQTPKLRPSTPYNQQVFTRYTHPLAYLQAVGRGCGVPRTMTPSQIPTPGASQSQGSAILGQGRGILSQYGATDSGPSPGRRTGAANPAEDKSEGIAPRRSESAASRRTSSSQRERRESPYKPYTPREPSMCKSEGWRKDANRMYAYLLAQSDPNITAEEADKLIVPVLDHMWCNRARWYWLKEYNPVEFSRLLNDLFQEIHHRCIPGMDTYVRWIKAGSWYHQSVLEREELNQCPHLQHAPLPSANITRPSDATLRSYRTAYEKSLRTKKQVLKNRRVYMATLRLHGMTAEADEIDPPRRAPATSTSAPTPSRSQQTVPMEVDRHGSPSTSESRSTGADCSQPRDQTRQSEQSGEVIYSQAGGDATPRQPSSVSWGDQMSADEGVNAAAGSDEWQTAHSKSSKRRRDPSSDRHQQQRLRKEARSLQPFPLRSYEERVAQVLQLYDAAGQLERASCHWVKRIVKSRYPRKTPKEIIYITNMVVAMISEFHLTSSCLPKEHCRPVVPPFVEDELPPVEEYLSEVEKDTQDTRILNGAAIKRIAVWLHRLEMIAFYGEEQSYSIKEQDHDDCELVKFLRDAGTCPFSEADIVARVIAENVERVYGSLRKTQRSLGRARCTLDGLIKKEQNIELELGNIPEGHPCKGAKSDELLQIRSQMERNRTTLDTHSKKLDSINRQLIEAGLKTTPESSDDEGDAEEASPSDTSSEAGTPTEEVGEVPEVEEEAEGEIPTPMEDEEVEALVVGADGVEGEEEDDGTITEAENLLLNTSPTSVPEPMDPDSIQPTSLESQSVQVGDRQA